MGYLSHLDEAGLLTRATFRSRLEDFTAKAATGGATRRDSTAKAVLTGSQDIHELLSRETTKDREAREKMEEKRKEAEEKRKGPKDLAKVSKGSSSTGSKEQKGQKERAGLKKA